MNDIFREVDEEYRQEQILAFWHRNAVLIILILVLAIAAAAGTGFWQSRKLATREQETYKLAHAEAEAETQKPADAAASLAAIAGQMSGSRVIPARFAAAQASINAGDTKGAIQTYEEIAADTKATSAERHRAAIRSIGLQLQDGEPAQLNSRLDKLAADDSAWRFSAKEWQALLAMRQNDMQKAWDIASALANDPKAPDGIHARAAQLAALAGEGRPAPAQPAAAQITLDAPTVQLPAGK